MRLDAENGRFDPTSQGRPVASIAILTGHVFESGFERGCLVGIALLAAASCGRSRRVYVARATEPSTRVVRIGAFASLTGQDAAIGADYQRGFESAINQWNQLMSARGVRVQLASYDDQSRPSAAAVAVQRLLDEDRVAVVVCPRPPRIDGRTAAADALVACAACPKDSASDVIGLAPSFRERAELLAELVVETMQLNKVAILIRHGVAADRAAADAFRASLKARDVATDDALTFTPETIADVLTKLASAAPQAVLVALDGNQAALVGRAMRRRAVPSALLFFGTPNLDVLPEADRATALEGALFPGFRDPSYSDNRIGDVGVERHLLGYDAAWQVCTALAHANTEDASALRRSIDRVGGGTSLSVARVQGGWFGELKP